MVVIHKWDAYRIYLIEQFLFSFTLALVWTLAMVYMIRVAGLDPLQLVLVGTALEVSAFTFEVPTGVVADVYSRRLSVILGYLMLGAGFLLMGLFPDFGVFLVSQIIAGIGYTFVSGAGAAWLADEIGEARAGKAYLRGSQMGSIGGICGIIVSVTLGMGSLALPMIFGSVSLMMCGVFLMLFMPENGFTPTPKAERETFKHMFSTFGSGINTVKRRPVLLTLLGAIFVFGAFSEGFDRLWVYHLENNFTLPLLGEFDPIIWYGIIGIVSSIIGMGFTEVVRRRLNTQNQPSVARALLVINTGIIVSVVIFALVGQFAIAMLAFWTLGALRGLNYPLQTAWINQGLDPKIRATVLSITAQADAIGQIAGGPGIGFIGRQFGVRAALAMGGLILSPVLLLYPRSIRQSHAEINAQVEPVVPV